MAEIRITIKLQAIPSRLERSSMKSFSHEFAVILLTVLSAVLLCACSGSGRSGYGPYDVTDYSALDAQQELGGL